MAHRQNNPNRIEVLRRQIARVEQTWRDGENVPVASGYPPVDRLLGTGGFRRGTLVEWLAAGQGSGAEALALTAAREACRQGGAAAVAWPERPDGRTLRRWQLAAEKSGALGLLIRPDSARNEPSWAEVRLLVEPLPVRLLQSHRRRLKIHLLRCRRAAGASKWRSTMSARVMHLAARGGREIAN